MILLIKNMYFIKMLSFPNKSYYYIIIAFIIIVFNFTFRDDI